MKRILLGTLRTTPRIWGHLVIGIIVSSLLYAILLTNGVSKITGLSITSFIALIIVILGLLLNLQTSSLTGNSSTFSQRLLSFGMEGKVTITPKRWQVFLVVIVLVGLAGSLLWGIGEIGFLFWNFLSRSQPTVGAAIIATSGTILISVLSVVLTQWFERNKELALKRREIEQEIREKHLPTYQELVQFLFKIFQSSKTGTVIPEEEVITFFSDFTQKMLVWGSDKFIKDFSAFRDSATIYAQQVNSGQATPAELINTMLALENLLYSIRTDCGHENKGLERGDLLTLFINDVRDFIPKKKILVDGNS